MRYNLLDYLAQYLHVDYVSELKNPYKVAQCFEYIQAIEPERFTLDDWKEACLYISKSNKDIYTIEDAKHHILNWVILYTDHKGR